MFKKFYFFAVALLCATTVLASNSKKDEYEYYEDEFEIDGIEYYAEDTISAYVFEHKNYKATTVVIPAYVTHNGFTYRVESIANKAFRDSKNLESITIGAAEIGEKAFCDCYNLQSITLLEGVEYINNAAFSGTAITTLHLPATFKNFGKNGYNSVPTTDCEAFSTYTVSPENPNFCAVDGILYTKDMKQLYSCPTLNQNFKGFAPTIEIVKQDAFNNCTLNVDTLVISDGVKYNSYAFSRAAIKNVRIESPEIPNGLFYASKIKSIIFGENVAKIGSSAFYNVKDCENITILGNTIPTWAFGSSSYSASILFTSQLLAKVQLNVPCGMKTIIESDHDKWATFLNVKEYFPYQFNAVANYNERGGVFIETDPKCDVEAVIKAEANSGYRFEHWCDGSTENPRSVAVDDDITLTAFFAPVYTPTSLDEQETLNIYAENGRIFGAENAQIYDLVGRNVTRENGNLHGIFVVKQNAQTQKIVVK